MPLNHVNNSDHYSLYINSLNFAKSSFESKNFLCLPRSIKPYYISFERVHFILLKNANFIFGHFKRETPKMEIENRMSIRLSPPQKKRHMILRHFLLDTPILNILNTELYFVTYITSLVEFKIIFDIFILH